MNRHRTTPAFPSRTVTLALALLLAGCGGGIEYEKRTGAGSTRTLTIAGKTLTVELALDDQARSTGLMFRESLDEDRGMLFAYRSPQLQGFWMRNVPFDLSIAFIDDTGKILQIEHMKAHDERQTRSKMKVRYALEVNRGWFRRNGIEVGDQFEDFENSVRDLEAR